MKRDTAQETPLFSLTVDQAAVVAWDVHEKNVVKTIDCEGLVKKYRTFNTYTRTLKELRV